MGDKLTESAAQTDGKIKRLTRFFYTEECGLALFQHRQSGKQFVLELDCWNDLIDCIRTA